MWQVFLDASALAKRYVPEPGSRVVDHVFAVAGPERLLCVMLGAAEVASVLVRCRNDGRLSSALFAQGMSELRREVIDAPEFATLAIPNAAIEAAIPLIDRHSLNTSDAVALYVALDLRPGLRHSAMISS